MTIIFSPSAGRKASNWDYRFNWVRDSSFAIQALYHLGHAEEARKHLNWFTGICKQHLDPAAIQPLYGMYGKTELVEEELYSLEGYRGSRPVRVGNNAYKQKQLDETIMIRYVLTF